MGWLLRPGPGESQSEPEGEAGCRCSADPGPLPAQGWAARPHRCGSPCPAEPGWQGLRVTRIDRGPQVPRNEGAGVGPGRAPGQVRRLQAEERRPGEPPLCFLDGTGRGAVNSFDGSHPPAESQLLATAANCLSTTASPPQGLPPAAGGGRGARRCGLQPPPPCTLFLPDRGRSVGTGSVGARLCSRVRGPVWLRLGCCVAGQV